MVKRIGGLRRKTRYKMQRDKRQKGKLNQRRFLQEFAIGDKILLKPDSIVQKGMFEPRYIGRVAVVSKKVGGCYEVLLKDNSVIKTLIVHPIHMVKY